MNVQQGFNRIGLTVATVFAFFAVVCLIVAGSNYVEYRSGIAAERERFFGQSKAQATVFSDAPVQLPSNKQRSWDRFKANRFRSVEQSLDLAAMCLVSGIIAIIFWWSVGWLSVFFRSAPWQRSS